MPKANHSPNENITITVALVRTRHGSRQMLAATDRSGRRLTGCRYDSALMAFARARRWLRLLEEGAVRDCAEIARITGLERSMVGKIMRLNYVSPSIVNRLVANRDAAGISLRRLFKITTPVWSEQEEALRG